MFRRSYDSLSMPAHLELLVAADVLCMKSWRTITEAQYDTGMVAGVNDYKTESVEHMAWPSDSTGKYHTKMPASMVGGGFATGEELHANMPDHIKSDHASAMAGTWWRCVSYSWLDPSDPSMNGGENSDAACWVIGVSLSESINQGDMNDESMHHTRYPVNALSHTYTNKSHPLRTTKTIGGSVGSLYCYKPFTDTSFMDCSYTLSYNSDYGFSTNITTDWTKGTGYNYIGDLGEALPSFVVTSGGNSIDADGYDTVEFKMVDSSGATINHASDIYLEHTGGYLPHHRVSITDGTGSFKVGALGMSSGDTFKVKIGFRTYTGIADVNYTVS